MPSAQQIYVLEVVFYKIELEPSVTIHSLDGLNLNFKFSQKVNFDIDTMYFGSPQVEVGSNGRNIDMNYGKTFLFVSTPSELRQLLQIEPYQITLLDGNKILGSTKVNWKKTFPDMVKAYNPRDGLKFTTVEERYEMKSDHEQRTAMVKMFIRMSCFGPNIQAMFQVKEEEGQKPQYIFRQKDLSKTFTIDRHIETRPTVTMRDESLTDVGEGGSLTQFFGTIAGAKASQPGDDDSDGIDMDFGDFDVASLCYRPSENKFFNFMNVVSADVKTHGKATCITIQKTRGPGKESIMKSKSLGGATRQSKGMASAAAAVIAAAEEEEDSIIHETAKEICQKLCGNRDCPAVMKFREYGIVPTEDNLQISCRDLVEPPVTNNICHVYKTISNYGTFSRPKKEELPFVPLQPVPVEPTKPCRMNKVEIKEKPQWHSRTCPLCPERLRESEKRKNKKRTSKVSC